MWIYEADLKVFKTHSDIRSYFKDVSMPTTISESNISSLGVKPVTKVSPPSYDYVTQILEEDLPVQINGIWTQSWKIRSATQEESNQRKIEVKEKIIKSVQNRLDVFAQSKGYDSILAATTYATSIVAEFKAEGQYAVEARDITWKKLFEIFADVDSGKRAMPNNYSEIESELPVLNWK
jgi:hypothetical protein